MPESLLGSKSWGALGVLILLMLGIGLLSNGITFGLWHLTEVPQQIVNTDLELSGIQRFWLRMGLIINHLGLFLIPGMIWLYMYEKGKGLNALGNRVPGNKQVLLWSVAILCSYPFIAWLAGWNMDLPLPEWMQSSNDATMGLMKQLLVMNNLPELIMNLLLVGLLAAIGEELIFRGIIQRFLQEKMTNPHLAIILSALIFGLFHMQFERMIPLAFLGLVLGYSYYYSKSIWLAVILHLLNNSIQVILLYFTNESDMPDIDSIPDIPIYVALCSILLTLSLAYIAIKSTKTVHEPRP